MREWGSSGCGFDEARVDISNVMETGSELGVGILWSLTSTQYLPISTSNDSHTPSS